MPELPEVETIRLSLETKLTGRTISGAAALYPKMVEGQAAESLTKQLEGRKIVGLERRGKYLLFNLSGDLVLALHLRMTGQLTVEREATPVAPATYFRLMLDNGMEMRFRDQRKFGKVFTYPADAVPPAIGKLGPEPLASEFTAQVLKQRFSRHQLAVKKALLNQEIVAGIGNIYADEALFMAGIHPARTVDSLDDCELEALRDSIRRVLRAGIEHRGTTRRDYRDAEGNPGSYQDKLQVYGRKGLPCPRCGVPVAKMNFGGRGTHFCPMCQK
jgi:formamidopyrimidine-DNA glycosylase